MITFEGVHGIKATVLAHSISPQGVEMITYEIEYPRMVLAELNTHGMLVRNSASSRAIPFKKMIEQLTARPVRFGAANPGMQDTGTEHTNLIAGLTAAEMWDFARRYAIRIASMFHEEGYHKQVYNRLTEPFQMMKTVISGTEWNNFMWLRDHRAADPTLAELARCIKEARALTTPRALKPGEWHLPYVPTYRYNGELRYYLLTENGDRLDITLGDAIKVSSARCAAVSFRNVDYGVEKCREVYARLIGDERKHASAFQHQATPMQPTQQWGWDEELTVERNLPYHADSWEPGVSHVDRDGQLWSAQLRGWIMHRKLIAGENVVG